MKGALGRIAVLMAVLTSLWAASAAGQLYRWVDPETGSVKLSSYPPPWFNERAQQRRAPKVEVIAPTKRAPAFEPRPETDQGPAPVPASDAPKGNNRAAQVKVVAQRIAALVRATPEAAERAFAELAESLKEFEHLDRQSKPDSRDQNARLEERSQLITPLESHRLALTQRIAGQRPPAGAAPEALAKAWHGTQLQLAALERTNEALRIMDPARVNARHFEMRALVEQVATMWEPHAGIASGRKDSGR